MALSNNPNETSARATKPEIILRFPLSEDLPIATRLRFIQYSRLHPNSDLSESTTSTITMPMPITIPDVASIRTTSQTDLGIWGNVTPENASKIDAMAKGGDANLGDVTNMGRSVLAEGIKRGWTNIQQNALRGLALAPIGGEDLKQTIATYAGVVANPHTTILFEGVSLKPINLEWRLSARSLDESNALRLIVQTIKERAHPEEISSGFALNYPDLVLVEFVGKPAEYLPKFQKAFVNNIVVTSDSGSGLAFFNSGAPTVVNIQLSLTEISIVTRDILEKQHNGTI